MLSREVGFKQELKVYRDLVARYSKKKDDTGGRRGLYLRGRDEMLCLCGYTENLGEPFRLRKGSRY